MRKLVLTLFPLLSIGVLFDTFFGLINEKKKTRAFFRTSLVNITLVWSELIKKAYLTLGVRIGTHRCYWPRKRECERKVEAGLDAEQSWRGSGLEINPGNKGLIIRFAGSLHVINTDIQKGILLRRARGPRSSGPRKSLGTGRAFLFLARGMRWIRHRLTRKKKKKDRRLFWKATCHPAL
jgi:hypothetical protein